MRNLALLGESRQFLFGFAEQGLHLTVGQTDAVGVGVTHFGHHAAGVHQILRGGGAALGNVALGSQTALREDPLRLRQEATQRRGRIETVVAGLAGEVAEGVFVVRTLEVVTGAPQMVLRQGLGAVCKGRGTEIGGAGQIITVEIVLQHRPAQHLAGDQVHVGIPMHAPVVGTVHLVVAGPQRQAGVVTQPLHLARRLSSDAPQQLLRLGIHRTAQGKILPHQNTVLIAEIVKHIIFVGIAAPAAHHVAADLV